MERLLDVTSEDLAGIYKDVAETVGIDNAYKIYHHFKGMQMIFPLKFYSNEYIAQQITQDYQNGLSVHNLVQKYEMSESRVGRSCGMQELSIKTRWVKNKRVMRYGKTAGLVLDAMPILL